MAHPAPAPNGLDSPVDEVFAGYGHPEGPLLRLQPGTFLKSSVGGELLAQGEVLQGERAACDQGGAQEPGQEGNEKAHGIAILLQLETTTISGRMGFRRSTRTMRSRKLQGQRVESRVGCKILNTMTALGMPESHQVG